MMIYALTTTQIIFIAVAGAIVAIGLFFALYIPISHLYHKKAYKRYYYKLIYKIALYKDYYLVNNFVFRLDQKRNATVDHILFGDKFIYIIIGQYYEGDLMGSASDPDLVLISKNGQKTYVENPYHSYNILLSRFSTATGIPTNLMIGIQVVNNNCRMNIATSSKQFYMVKRKDLKKLIKLIESRPVDAIQAENLQKAVLIVNDLNRKNFKKI